MAHVLERLTPQECQRILYDLTGTRKKDHWIWWGFPLSRAEVELQKNVSKQTLYYALREEEVHFLLKEPVFLTFYEEALQAISSKGKHNTEIFFSTVDLDKFIRHIRFFGTITSYLTEQKKIHFLLVGILQWWREKPPICLK